MNNETQKANATSDTTINTSSVSTKTQCEDTIPKKIVGIYGLRNKTTGKWYVGQSIDIEDRWKYYKRLKCKGQPKIYNSLLKYGYDGFDKIILEECSSCPKMLVEREIFWVQKYNSIIDGYNIRNPDLRSKFSDETRAKITASKTGKKYKPCSEKARENMSAARRGEKHHFYGKKLSDEHRAKLKKAKQVISEETRKKMSMAAKNRTPPSEEARRKMSEASKNYWANMRLTSADSIP